MQILQTEGSWKGFSAPLLSKPFRFNKIPLSIGYTNFPLFSIPSTYSTQ
jgi:hypothetical protein